MEREKVWWTVKTDCGTRRTFAVSKAKAVRNVRFRLVMDDRAYDRPTPRDFAEMRDIEVIDAWADDLAGLAERSSAIKSGEPHEGTRV